MHLITAQITLFLRRGVLLIYEAFDFYLLERKTRWKRKKNAQIYFEGGTEPYLESRRSPWEKSKQPDQP